MAKHTSFEAFQEAERTVGNLVVTTLDTARLLGDFAPSLKGSTFNALAYEASDEMETVIVEVNTTQTRVMGRDRVAFNYSPALSQNFQALSERAKWLFERQGYSLRVFTPISFNSRSMGLQIGISHGRH